MQADMIFKNENQIENYEITNNNEDKDTDILQEFNTSKPIIDQIQEKYGYGINTWSYFFTFFLISFIVGICVLYFSFMMVPYKFDYNLYSLQISFLFSQLFWGMCIGSLIVNYFVWRFKRMYILHLFLSYFIY